MRLIIICFFTFFTFVGVNSAVSKLGDINRSLNKMNATLERMEQTIGRH